MTKPKRKTNKKGKEKQIIQVKMQKIPEKFKVFEDCVNRVKKSTYMIVRGKKQIQDGKETINWKTLGTGVVVAPHRMITCSHVINDPQSNSLHADGDLYYLVRHDDDDHFHIRVFTPKVNKELFLYPEKDLGIIYLDKEFYQFDNKILKLENEFVKISKDIKGIGTEIGILGYPLCNLGFFNGDVSKPIIGNILLRTDKGIINCSYKDPYQLKFYEFTLQFNSGNSGGPIFDINTGKLVGIIQGYRQIAIKVLPLEIEEENNGIKQKHKSFDIHHAYYSRGISVLSFGDIFIKHNI
ncbi:MAG: serine protease [Candidatus Absconditicoccaceae bacterium]